MNVDYRLKFANQEVIIKSLESDLTSKCVCSSMRMCMMTMRMC